MKTLALELADVNRAPLTNAGLAALGMSQDRETALILAAGVGRPEAVALLLGHGAKVDATDIVSAKAPSLGLRASGQAGSAQTLRAARGTKARRGAMPRGRSPACWAWAGALPVSLRDWPRRGNARVVVAHPRR